jgi:archaellum biogenesis ATPase FlaH
MSTSPAAERAVVATLIETANGELPPTLARLLAHAPDSFDDLRHGAIAATVRQFRAEGRPVYPAAIAECAGVEGAPLLVMELAGQGLPLDLAELEAGPVWKSYHQRRIKSVCGDAIAALEANPDKAEVIADGVKHALSELDGEHSEHLSIRTPDEILALPQNDLDNLLGDRLLAKGQLLTILGPGGVGKSRLLLQLAVMSITGRPFIGLETHAEGLRWLIFQTENGNRRLQSDLAHLRDAVGQDWQIVNESLFIHTLETDRDGWLSLESEANQTRIATAIRRHSADVVGFDPLNQICIGDPNKDMDMAATCQAIMRLSRAGNPLRSPIVLHHALTGRAGASRAFGLERASYGRNSKVLQAWTRGQINVAPVSEDNNDTLAVACGKCSNGKEFPPFAIRLNPATMIYEVAPDVDLDAWREDVTGRKSGPDLSPERIRDIVADLGKTDGSPSKARLAKAIMDETGCARSGAYNAIDRAERTKTIHYTKTTKSYVAK